MNHQMTALLLTGLLLSNPVPFAIGSQTETSTIIPILHSWETDEAIIFVHEGSPERLHFSPKLKTKVSCQVAKRWYFNKLNEEA